MNEISGGYPGGPRRTQDAATPGDRSAADVRSGESIEGRIGDGVYAFKELRRKRARRLIVGIVALVGIGTGVYLGFSSIQTAEDLAQAQRDSIAAQSVGLEGQADRVMRELWKMEDVEAARNSSRGR